MNKKSYEQMATVTRQEYGRVGVFRIKMRSLVQKLKPLEKCHFCNCSDQIESHRICKQDYQQPNE